MNSKPLVGTWHAQVQPQVAHPWTPPTTLVPSAACQPHSDNRPPDPFPADHATCSEIEMKFASYSPPTLRCKRPSKLTQCPASDRSDSESKSSSPDSDPNNIRPIHLRRSYVGAAAKVSWIICAHPARPGGSLILGNIGVTAPRGRLAFRVWSQIICNFAMLVLSKYTAITPFPIHFQGGDSAPEIDQLRVIKFSGISLPRNLQPGYRRKTSTNDLSNTTTKATLRLAIGVHYALRRHNMISSRPYSKNISAIASKQLWTKHTCSFLYRASPTGFAPSIAKASHRVNCNVSSV